MAILAAWALNPSQSCANSERLGWGLSTMESNQVMMRLWKPFLKEGLEKSALKRLLDSEKKLRELELSAQGVGSQGLHFRQATKVKVV